MTEFYDDLINDALGDFRDQDAATSGLAPGADEVRSVVKRRRRVRLTVLSVVSALAVAAPIAAFATNPHRNNAPPLPNDSGGPGVVMSASPDSSRPSAAPPSVPGIDGRITLGQLAATTVDIPPFQTDTCPAHKVRLVSKSTVTQEMWVAKLVYTNLDDDPALETAALLSCRSGEAPENQVVAFDRDASGKIRSLGRVVGQGYKLNVRDISARASGGVTADVSDIVACCDTPVSQEQHQHRSYAWNGTKFAQVGGPAVFGDPARVTDLAVRVSDVTLGPASDGKRSGSATVTVKNNGPNPSGRFQVGFGNCTFSCAAGMPFFAWGDHNTYHAPLASGQQATTTVNFSFDAGTPGGTIEAFLTAVSVDSDKQISDLKPANDTTTFHVRSG
jgi:hypothetical protein